jgi:hypothetical protein
MSEEMQSKAKPALPLIPLETPRMTKIQNPIEPMVSLSPQEISRQVKIAKEVAEFFKNHWLWFYMAAGLAFYRGVTATRVNAAIFRIDRALTGKEKIKNPVKRKKKK